MGIHDFVRKEVRNEVGRNGEFKYTWQNEEVCHRVKNCGIDAGDNTRTFFALTYPNLKKRKRLILKGLHAVQIEPRDYICGSNLCRMSMEN